MEAHVIAKLVADYYGGKGYLAGNEQIKRWLAAQINRLKNPKLRELEEALENDKKLEEILSVHNTDENGYPIIGEWMLFECSRNAAKLANTWGKFVVSADDWKNSVRFSPMYVNLFNGNGIIKEAEGLEGYAITTKVNGKRVSFFKSYQLIKAGAKFEFDLSFPEDLCTKIVKEDGRKEIVPDIERSQECVATVVQKMGAIGLGAYRVRFGKFTTQCEMK